MLYIVLQEFSCWNLFWIVKLLKSWIYTCMWYLLHIRLAENLTILSDSKDIGSRKKGFNLITRVIWRMSFSSSFHLLLCRNTEELELECGSSPATEHTWDKGKFCGQFLLVRDTQRHLKSRRASSPIYSEEQTCLTCSSTERRNEITWSKETTVAANL